MQQNTTKYQSSHLKLGAKYHCLGKSKNNDGDIQLFLVHAYMTWLVNMPPVTQGKSKMAGYGKQVLVRDAFLWFMSAIYLFAFSSLYVQIPG